MLFGDISPVEDPTAITQGTCPAGFAFDPSLGFIGMAFPCIPVETTASTPGGIVDTNPSKQSALPLSRNMIFAVGAIGVAAGVILGLLRR